MELDKRVQGTKKKRRSSADEQLNISFGENSRHGDSELTGVDASLFWNKVQVGFIVSHTLFLVDICRMSLSKWVQSLPIVALLFVRKQRTTLQLACREDDPRTYLVSPRPLMS